MFTIDRRRLLLGAGSSALLAGAALAAPMPLPAPSKGTPTAKPGVILNGFFDTDFPFRNLMLGASTLKAAGSYAVASVLDDNGYPTATPQSQIGGTLPVPSSYQGRYIVTWTGTGRFQLSLGGQANQIVVYSGGANVIGLGRASGTVSYNLTIDGTNPQVEFAFIGTPPARMTFYYPAAGTYAGMSNLILCRTAGAYAGDLAAIKSGAIENCFNEDFVTKVKALNPSAIRVMDWIGVNNSFVTRYKYLTQPGYYTGSGSRWLRSLWAGTVIGAGTAFSCGAAPDTPAVWTDGETIQCQFQNASTATPILGASNNGFGLIRLQLPSTAGLSTGQRICVDAYNVSGGQQGGGVWTIEVVSGTHIDLLYTYGGVPSVFEKTYISGGVITTATLNVAGRGAKLITTRFGGKENSQGATNPSIAAGAIATLVYDAAFDVLMYRAGGLNNGVSLDVAVGLANKLGTGLWYCFPHMMNDDGVTSIVSFIKTKLNSNLPCYLEYSNEIWNYIFDQTIWSANRGIGLKLAKDSSRREFGWYGLRHRQVMGIATNVWGNRPSLNRVMAVQLFGAPSTNDRYRFKGADLGSVGYDAAPNRPIDYSDVIAYAPYYSGGVLTNFDGSFIAAGLSALVKAADDYASGEEARMAAALSWVDDDVRAGTRNDALGDNTVTSIASKRFPGWESLAGTHSKSVVWYEGGYEGAAPSSARCKQLGIPESYGGTEGKIGLLVKAYKNSPLFRQLVVDQMKQFMSLPHSKVPSWFTFGGGVQWSILPGDLYTPPYQSYYALQQFNR